MNNETTFTGKEAGILQPVAERQTSPLPATRSVTTMVMLLVFTVGIPLLSTAGMQVTTQSAGPKNSMTELITCMRRLMLEHVTLTRNIILCLVNDQPGIDSAVTEIVNNQIATGNLIKKYYGDEAGKKFTRLLYTDITRTADVMIACRNSHNKAYEKAEKRWKENTEEIVAFLTQANPSPEMYTSRKILYDEMKSTADEIWAIKNNKSDSDKEAYGKTQQDALVLADLLSETIILSFPERFPGDERIPVVLGQK